MLVKADSRLIFSGLWYDLLFQRAKEVEEFYIADNDPIIIRVVGLNSFMPTDIIG